MAAPMRMKTVWGAGSPFEGDAQAISDELHSLTGADHVIKHEAIVAHARSEKSLLHSAIFDGTTAEEALEKYHLGRARMLLNFLRMVPDEPDA